MLRGAGYNGMGERNNNFACHDGKDGIYDLTRNK